MAVAPGDPVILARMPGYRVASNTLTADSATFTTTETQVQSVTASVISGVVYKVFLNTTFQSTNAGDVVVIRIRLTNTSGTLLQTGTMTLGTGSLGPRQTLLGFFTAASTGSQVVIVSGQRLSGSGNVNLDASASDPSIFYVEVQE